MKRNRIFSMLTAGVLAFAALPVCHVGAEETDYLPGDVDMDGVITGHDSAVISRALYVTQDALTAEQLVIADINGDRVVDQTDLEWVHGQEEYTIGDFDMDSYTSSLDARNTLIYSTYHHIGYLFQITQEHNTTIGPFDVDHAVAAWNTNFSVSQTQLYLMDADGNGRHNYFDAVEILQYNSYVSAGLKTGYFEDGRYDLNFSKDSNYTPIAY